MSEAGGFYSVSQLERMKDDDQHELEELTQGVYKIDLGAGGMRFLPDTELIDSFVHYQALVNNFGVADEQGNSFQPQSSHPLQPVDRDRITALKARISDVKAGRQMYSTEKGYPGLEQSQCENAKPQLMGVSQKENPLLMFARVLQLGREVPSRVDLEQLGC